jgi:hypothetical protein
VKPLAVAGDHIIGQVQSANAGRRLRCALAEAPLSSRTHPVC